MGDSDDRTLFCGNISSKITEAILYELFLQMGPLNSVRVPRKDGAHRGFAFVEFKHESAIPYTLAVLQGTSLDGREMNLRSNSRQQQQGAGNAGRDRFGGQSSNSGWNQSGWQQQQPIRDQGWQHQQPTREQGWSFQGQHVHHYNQPMREHSGSGRRNDRPGRGFETDDRQHHHGGRDQHNRHRDAPYQRDQPHHKRW